METVQKAEKHHGHEKRHRIEFTVDNERLEAYSDEPVAHLTVREILDLSGNQPPEEYELIEYRGPHHKEEVKHDNLDEVLAVQEHAKFAALFKGPTPVS